MRRFLLLALMLPNTALADQILAKSHISQVTVYPEGAQITREINFEAAIGAHDLLITDLPLQTLPELIRLSAPQVQLGAFALRNDRLPPRPDDSDPALAQAKAAIKAAEVTLRQAQAAVAAINAKVEAAEAQAEFLRGVKPDAVTVQSLTDLTAAIGAQVLVARQAALAAQADLPDATEVVDDAQKTRDDAKAAYDALSQRAQEYASLSVSLTVETAGLQHLTMTHFVGDAGWEPVYDLSLTRKDPKLTIARGVLVSQSSGEDWQDVDLTLSTAQPSEQSEPSILWPDLRRTYDPAQGYADAQLEAMVEPAPVAATAPARKVESSEARFEGDVVVYHYPGVVDVAAGVEDLRLALDEITVTPQVEARAVPLLDPTAFVLASFVNESKEMLLPGMAYLFRDGTLVGANYITGIAAGAKAEVAFGAIDGLRLTRKMPERSEGERGFINSSNQLQESAVIKVENLTDESWPLRVLDRVPYSEQEELEISYNADPKPTDENFDDKRGVLSWQFDLAAGASQEITLTHLLSWPEGKEIQ